MRSSSCRGSIRRLLWVRTEVPSRRPTQESRGSTSLPKQAHTTASCLPFACAVESVLAERNRPQELEHPESGWRSAGASFLYFPLTQAAPKISTRRTSRSPTKRTETSRSTSLSRVLLAQSAPSSQPSSHPPSTSLQRPSRRPGCLSSSASSSPLCRGWVKSRWAPPSGKERHSSSTARRPKSPTSSLSPS